MSNTIIETQIETETLRHSAAHIVAQAVKRLYPEAKLGIGPATKSGFYYEIFSDDLSLDSLNKESFFAEVEAEIEEIIESELSFTQVFMSKDEALDMLYRHGEIFKTEILQSLNQEKVSFYKTGEEFIDLCRGPHVDHTGKVRGIKLTKLSEHNWLNDSARPQLLRIEGIAFANKETLAEYLQLQEKIKANNHIKLGTNLALLKELNVDNNNLIQILPRGTKIVDQLRAKIDKLATTIGLQKTELNQIYQQDIKVDTTANHLTNSNFRMHLQPSLEEFANIVNIVKTKNIDIYSYLQFLRSPKDAKPNLTNYYTGISATGQKQVLQEHTRSELTQNIRAVLNLYNPLLETKLKLQITISENYANKLNVEEIVEGLGIEVRKKVITDHQELVTVEFIYEDPLNISWELSQISVIEENSADKNYKFLYSLTPDIYRLFALILEKTQGKLPLDITPYPAILIPESQENMGYAQLVKQKLRNQNLEVSVMDREEAENIPQELVGYYLSVGDNEEKNKVITPKTPNGEAHGLMSVEEFLHKFIEVS